MRLIRSEVLELAGADAMAFAQAQLMNDVRALADGEWQWSGWLTPKGRLVAFFAVVRVSADRLLFWLPDGGADALATSLSRFVFRSKVTLHADPPWAAVGSFGPRPTLPDGTVLLTLPLDTDGTARHLLLVPAEARPPTGDGETDAAEESRWHLADLALGVPYIAAGKPASEQFIPHWLSLQRLDAFSLGKGCYPGQEIVARMHYLGQSKRAAFHLTGDGSPPPPMSGILDKAGQPLGEIVWAQSDGSLWRALAVLRTGEEVYDVSIRQHGRVGTCDALTFA